VKQKELLSAISPVYALTQGKLPGGLGLGVDALNRIQDKKRRKKEKERLEAEQSEKQGMEKAMSGVGGTTGMKAGGRVKSIDGIAIRGKTKGRII
tara:strand:+ start:1317 stop:1601 length:285 start_codon:yes stop_codon:yes gene_type:complete